MLEHESPLEREQRGVGDIQDDDFGSDEQSAKLFDGHRFRAGVAGLGFGDWA
jgi:hypothetical protein